jgi:hypothetical protein
LETARFPPPWRVDKIPAGRRGEKVLMDWKLSDVIAATAAVISLVAMGITAWQGVLARRSAQEARRQADAALGEVDPLVFLDARPFESPQTTGGRASLTLVNHNRRDIRLIEIEITSDPAIVVAVNTGKLRDALAANLARSRSETGSVKFDLRDKHYIVQGSSVGVPGSREIIPLDLTRIGDRPYAKGTADIEVAVRYVLLDARHTEKQVKVFVTVPFLAS